MQPKHQRVLGLYDAMTMVTTFIHNLRHRTPKTLPLHAIGINFFLWFTHNSIAYSLENIGVLPVAHRNSVGVKPIFYVNGGNSDGNRLVGTMCKGLHFQKLSVYQRDEILIDRFGAFVQVCGFFFDVKYQFLFVYVFV